MHQPRFVAAVDVFLLFFLNIFFSTPGALHSARKVGRSLFQSARALTDLNPLLPQETRKPHTNIPVCTPICATPHDSVYGRRIWQRAPIELSHRGRHFYDAVLFF